VLKFLIRLLLIIAGLIFAASLMIVMMVLLAAWGLRALWCKLTGQPVNPFAMRMDPRAGFERVFKQGGQHSQGSGKPPRRVVENVTDVEPKH
jgi:flagellar biosynthesis protein FlhB